MEEHRRSRRGFLVTTGTLGTAALAGCSGTNGSDAASTKSTQSSSSTTTGTTSKPTHGGTITYSSGDDSQKLNPHYTIARASTQVLVNVCETLFQLDDSFEPKPHLLADHSVSDDGKTYTLKLKQGIQFHPPVSRELVAKDVTKSLQVVANDKTATAHIDFKSVESIETTGTYTTKITLSKPFTPMLTTLANESTAILPHDYDKTSKHPVGTGPFTFEKREKGNYTKLSKFDDYWQDDLPYPDAVEARPISDGTSRFDALKTGRVDVATTIPSKDVSKVKQDSKLEFDPLKGLAVEQLIINTNRDPLGDKRVRKAIRWCIDKEKLVKFALDGYGEPAVTMLPPQSPYAIDTKPGGQNYDKAKQLLSDAGRGDGFDVKIKLPQSYPRSVKLGTPLQQWLKQVGINAELERVTWDTWTSDVEGNMNYDITSVPFYGAYNPNLALNENFHTGALYNMNGYSNSKLDDLLDKANQMKLGSDRQKVVKKAQKVIRDDCPMIFPFYRDQLYCRRTAVDGQLTWGAGYLRLWNNWLESSN